MTTTPLNKRFQAIEDDMKTVLVELDNEIHGCMLAALTRSHVFFLGLPGEAKSYMINHFLARIGGVKTFSILMGNFTNPEDLFGPYDMTAMRAGVYKRVTEGYMPDAHFSFNDEIWKGNDSINNSLLQITNERKFRQGGKLVRIPLMSMFAASNELPSNDGLAAIADRILQWFQVEKIQEPANFMVMLGLDSDPDDVEPMVDLEDLVEAQRQIRAIPISDAVKEALTEVRQELRDKNIEPSDRRFKQMLELLKAEAWLEGYTVVGVDQFPSLVNALWSDPSQIPTIDAILSEKANPREREALELLGDIDKIGELVNKALEDDDEERRTSTGMEVHPKVIQAFKAVKDIQADPKISRRQEMLAKQCEEKLKTHSYKLLREIFSLSEQQIEDLHEESKKSA